MTLVDFDKVAVLLLSALEVLVVILAFEVPVMTFLKAPVLVPMMLLVLKVPVLHVYRPFCFDP